MERLCVTPIEHELRFKDWLKRNNVEQILFDLDNTLCSTRELFLLKVKESVNIMGRGILEINKLSEDLEETNNEYFEKIGVNPKRWYFVIKELRSRWNIPEDTACEALRTLRQIYTTPVKFLDGAQETLGFLTKTNTKFGIVTHANEYWTRRKFSWLGLGRFISWDNVFIVDENIHKTAESWQKAAVYFKTNPSLCVVVGDSPRADMCAGEVGFKHLFLINSDKGRWSIHNVSVPEMVNSISSVADIIHLGCCQP